MYRRWDRNRKNSASTSQKSGWNLNIGASVDRSGRAVGSGAGVGRRIGIRGERFLDVRSSLSQNLGCARERGIIRTAAPCTLERDGGQTRERLMHVAAATTGE